MPAEAEIKFECTRCGQRLTVDAAGAGQHTSCPACHESLVVPLEDVITRIAALNDTRGDWEDSGRLQSASEKSEAESSAIRDQLVEAMHARARMSKDIAAARAELEALQAQLHQTTVERDQLTSHLEQVLAERQEIEAVQAGMSQELDELRRQGMAQQSEIGQQSETIQSLQQQLENSKGECTVLAGELVPLRQEVQQLRERVKEVDALDNEVKNLKKDIAASSDAEECRRLRIQAEAAEEKQKVQAEELGRLREDVERLSKDGEELRRELKVMSERCSEAEQKVEALAESKVQIDNEVLRGLLGRQKGELENCYRELKRFRRAQLGLRLVYALFALALLGVAAFALQVMPGLSEFLEEI